MASQRKRLEKTLRGCADAGVPETTDLWPVVKERVFAGRVGTEPAGPGESDTAPRPRSRASQLVPNTPLGWALVAVSVLILGFEIYAAVEPVGEFYRQGLPGTVEPGYEKADEHPSRGGGKGGEGRTVGQTQVADGVEVTLKDIHADAEFVTIRYTVQDRENRNIDGHPSELTPVQMDDTDREPAAEASELPLRVDLTGESDQDFDMVGGSTSHSESPDERWEPKEHLAVFAPSEGLNLGGKERLHFKVVLEEAGLFLPGKDSAPTNPNSNVGPFTFDIEVPVAPVPVVKIDKEETTKGIALTLDRVVNSPVRPQAIFCFDPPDEEHSWTPWLAPADSATENEAMSPQRLNDGCWSLTMDQPVEGRSSITVAELMGIPRNSPDFRQGPETIRGPWTFEFDAPQH